jgi:hypothetical protein
LILGLRHHVADDGQKSGCGLGSGALGHGAGHVVKRCAWGRDGCCPTMPEEREMIAVQHGIKLAEFVGERSA